MSCVKICEYTSAEGRACRNPALEGGLRCVHHTCRGCGGPKQSRMIACPACLQKAQAGKTQTVRPTQHQRAVLAAKAAVDRPLAPHTKHALELFGQINGADAKPKRVNDLGHKFNYAAIEFSADEVFKLYDTDNSGTISEDELEHVLYDCGIKLTEDALRMARELLGLKKPGDTCSFEVFDKWWKATYSKSRSARAALIAALGREIQEFLIPEIKTLFAEHDVDCSGALDEKEFAVFYPKLKDFLGYEIPPQAKCLVEMDSVRTSSASDLRDGAVEYAEFEAWFLEMEKKRMDSAAKAAK